MSKEIEYAPTWSSVLTIVIICVLLYVGITLIRPAIIEYDNSRSELDSLKKELLKLEIKKLEKDSINH